MASVSALPRPLPAVLIWMMTFQCCSSQHERIETTTTYMDASSFDYNDIDELCETREMSLEFRRWFMPPFFSVICVLALAGNILVIVTSFYFNRLKTMTDVYLLNLSFADLLFAMSLPFWAANSTTDWVLGLALCKAMYTVYKVSFYSGMFLLSFISVDRYFAIAKAVTTHRYRSQAMLASKVSSAAIWVVALIFSIPEMNYSTITNKTCTSYNNLYDPLRVRVEMSQFALAFVFPLVIMTICYSCIIKTLCQARAFERNKAIKVILAVVAVFLVSQVPYNVVLIWYSVVITSKVRVCTMNKILLIANDVTQALAFLRCCLNPFVYAFIGVKFRHDLLKLLKNFGCLSQEMFYRYTFGRRRSSAGTDTESTVTFSP